MCKVLEGIGPALIEVASQYLYRRKEESQSKQLHKTSDVLTEILTGDLPNKCLKIRIYLNFLRFLLWTFCIMQIAPKINFKCENIIVLCSFSIQDLSK